MGERTLHAISKAFNRPNRHHHGRDKIRVYLVISSDVFSFISRYDFLRLTTLITSSQNIFDFILVDGDGGHLDQKLSLKRTIPTLNVEFYDENASAAMRESVADYKLDIDIFSQIVNYISNRGIAISIKDLILGVTSSIIVPDLITSAENSFTNKLYGNPDNDAYSCLGTIMSMGVSDNNSPKMMHNTAVISLSRLYIVFSDLNISMTDPSSRAKISRYVIGNICHFLSGSVFGRSLVREHRTNCVAETNWEGGELASYYSKGLCKSCEASASRMGSAIRYNNFTSNSLVLSINRIAQVSDRVEFSVRRARRYVRFLEFSTITMAVGIFSNLLAGLGNEKLSSYATLHIAAVSFVFVFILSGIVFSFAIWKIYRSLP